MSSITGDLVTDVESANGLVSASPTSIDVEKKELAGNHVLMIKIWELIRLGNSAVFIYCPNRHPFMQAILAGPTSDNW